MAIFTVTLNPTIDQIMEVIDFEVGGTFRVLSKSQFPLGKGISVALALKTLGDSALAVALVGRDQIPMYEEFLESQGIEYHLFPISGDTRTNMTVIDPERQTVTHLRERGFTVDVHNIQDLKKWLDERVEPGDWVIFSGSLPPGAPITTYKDLIQPLQARRVQCALDTSGLPLKEGVKAKPMLIKPNLEELSEILETELEWDETFETIDDIIQKMVPLIKEGIPTICLTLGDKGAVSLHQAETCWVQVNVNNAKNTVGCGDSFLAGFLNAWEHEESLLETTKWGVAAGAANTQVSGAGILNFSDVQHFYEQIQVVAHRSPKSRP